MTATTLAQEQLDELCLSATERLTRALDSGDPDVAKATYAELEAAMRAFCVVYQDWLALTDEYLFEVDGHQAHAHAARPERMAELAGRAGATLEELVQGQQMLAGDDHPLGRRLRAEIGGGDSASALGTWAAAQSIWRKIHDLRRDAISDLLGYIYRRKGASGLEDALRYAAPRGWWRTSMPADFALSPEQRLRELAFMLTVGAFSRLRITDHGDHWIVHQLVCGNCGSQVCDRYKSDEDWGLELITDRGPLTFGQKALTAYQAHLAVIHHSYAIDLVGVPWPAFECAGLQAGAEECRLFVYKDPKRTHARHFAIVGREPGG